MNIWFLSSLVVSCLVAGCLGRGEFTPVRYYSLNSPSASVLQTRRSWPVPLGVRPFTAAPRYRDRMLYRSSDVAVGFYEYDRWVEPPAEMVTQAVTSTLRASGLFQQVIPADRVRLPAWILRGEVLRFDEVRTAAKSQAECWLRVELRRARDEQLVWLEVFRVAVPLTAETPEALAQAMSRAVQQIATQLIAALEKADLSRQ